MEKKHTPGPWRIDPSYDRKRNVIPNRFRGIFQPRPDSEYGSLSCVMIADYNGEDAFISTSEANKRLIGAAPEMLDALQTVISEDWLGDSPLANYIKTILAKIDTP